MEATKDSIEKTMQQYENKESNSLKGSTIEKTNAG